MQQSQEPTTEHYKKLIAVLGKKYIRAKVESPFDFIHIANRGVKAQVIKNFITHFNLPIVTTAHLLNISGPTIYRWLRTNKTLDRNASVKLFEVTDLFLYGTEIFGSRDNFYKWLSLPNTALGGMEPGALLEIPGGISKVKDLLGRIEYGVYS